MSDPLLTGAEASATFNRGVALPQLKVLNAAAFVATLALNGLSSAGVLSDYAVGEISDKHDTKITPAGAAFSIWGVIYMLQVLFVAYQFLGWPLHDEPLLLHGIGFWFIGACTFNSLWIVTFVQGTDAALWFSTILIASLLFCLCKIYVNVSCWASARPGGLAQALVIDVHFSMYASWVTVATIVNVALTLDSTGWEGEPATETAWGLVMLVVALMIGTFIVVSRRDCVWGLVLAWASFWIASASSDDDAVFAGAAAVCAVISLVSLGVGLLGVVAWARAS